MKILPHHEFWNANILLSFVWPHYLWHMIKTGDVTYFTAANPAIEDGGFFGEKKTDILSLIPPAHVPKYVYIDGHSESAINEVYGLALPVIAKPDVGQRGYGVTKISSKEELEQYLSNGANEVIVQEFVEYPEEYGVLFYRIPDTDDVEISSVIKKEYLSVVGDGYSNVMELISGHPRYARYENEVPVTMRHVVPQEGETYVVSEIGNHCRGTIFRDRRDLITAELKSSIRDIVLEMDGVYYGRFDLKCSSEEDFTMGRNLKILELNGVTSDPAHIFDPEYPLRQAIKDLYADARVITRIAKANKKRGAQTTPLKELISKTWKYYFNLK